MMRRELFHQSRGQSVPHHQEEGDHDVMVALVVVQLGVALEDVEDNIDELLLQPFPLVIRHPCGDSTRWQWDGLCHLPAPAVGASAAAVCKERTCVFTNPPDPKGRGAKGREAKLAEKLSQALILPSKSLRAQGKPASC